MLNKIKKIKKATIKLFLKIYLSLCCVSLIILAFHFIHLQYKPLDKENSSLKRMPSNQESLSIKKVQISERHDAPYLAITIEEHEELEISEQIDLITKRAGKICKTHGYYSALDLEIDRYKGDYLVDISSSNKEILIETDSSVKVGSIIIDTTIFVLTGGVGTVTAVLLTRGGAALLGTVAVLALEFGVSYSIHKATVKKLKDVDLESMYAKYFANFSEIICLDVKKGVSEEEITEFDLRYACHLDGQYTKECDDLNVDDLLCVLNIERKQSLEKHLESCKNLTKRFNKNFEKISCGMAIVNERNPLEKSIDICSKSTMKQSQCITIAAPRWNKLSYIVEECSKVNTDFQLQCVTIAAPSWNNLNYIVEECAKVNTKFQSQCVTSKTSKWNNLSYIVEECAKVNTDLQLQCVNKASNWDNLNYIVEECAKVNTDLQLQCVNQASNWDNLNYIVEECSKVNTDFQLQCVTIAAPNWNNLSYIVEECAKVNTDFQSQCVTNQASKWNNLSYIIEECAKVNADFQLQCVNKASKWDNLSSAIEECAKVNTDLQLQCITSQASKWDNLRYTIEKCSKK